MNKNKDNLSEDIVKFIIERMKNNAQLAFNDAVNDKDNIFEQGRKFAYYEMLDTIKNTLIGYNQDLSDYGLSDNLENKYLGYSLRGA